MGVRRNFPEGGKTGGANENFTDLARKQHMIDVIIFKFQGAERWWGREASTPGCPRPPGAYGSVKQ